MSTTIATIVTLVEVFPQASACHTRPNDQPQYRHVGDGRFLPDNQAAIEECRRFNAWVEEVNARARGGSAQ